MLHLILWQADATPAWVGPTMAISLAVVALAFLGIAIAIGVVAVRIAAQIRKIGAIVDGLQDHAADTLKSARRLLEQAQDVLTVVRSEAGAFAHTGRRLRRQVMRGADRVEGKLRDLEALYDVVQAEVEDTALGVAATLRSVRHGGSGLFGRLRQVLAPKPR